MCLCVTVSEHKQSDLMLHNAKCILNGAEESEEGAPSIILQEVGLKMWSDIPLSP